MALTSVIPAAGSIINTGDTVTVVTDDAGGITNIYHVGTGTTEVVFRDGPGYSAGFAGSYAEVGGSATAAFRRNAGWDSSPFTISVETASATYTVTYTLLAEGQYPPDMQPFNDPVPDTGSSDIAIQDDGSPQGTATTINYAAGLTATVSGGVAQIDTAAGSGDVTSSESAGTVVDNEVAQFDGTTGKLIKGSGAIIANGVLAVDVVNGNQQLASNGYLSMTGSLPKIWMGEYSAGSPIALPGTGVFWVKESGTDANSPMFTDGEGTEVDLSAGPGGGDVSSSESAGTVAQNEVVLFDGTTGKLVKSAGSNVYSSFGEFTAPSFTATNGNITTFADADVTGVIISWEQGATPSALASRGQYWTKSATDAGEAQNRPYFTADDGTEYDLSVGTTNYSSIVDLNADISPDHVSNVHIQSTTPAVSVDGDIWIETS